MHWLVHRIQPAWTFVEHSLIFFRWQVLEPNLRDFHGLLDAIANNTLTTGVPGNYDANAFLAREGKTRKSWITGACIIILTDVLMVRICYLVAIQ